MLLLSWLVSSFIIHSFRGSLGPTLLATASHVGPAKRIVVNDFHNMQRIASVDRRPPVVRSVNARQPLEGQEGTLAESLLLPMYFWYASTRQDRTSYVCVTLAKWMPFFALYLPLPALIFSHNFESRVIFVFVFSYEEDPVIRTQRRIQCKTWRSMIDSLLADYCLPLPTIELDTRRVCLFSICFPQSREWRATNLEFPL